VPAPTDLPVLEFADRAALEAWLDEHHVEAPGVYLRMAKKGSGTSSVSLPEVVETLLCFGWIDGRVNPVDERSYLLRVTPRRPRSAWSQRNVDTVARLIEEGRMRPAGLAAVEAAKADGRWERAYGGRATIVVPDDLAAALAADPAAQQAFDALPRSDRWAVLYWVHTAASPVTRARRIARFVQTLREHGRLR
jgi:uncharacterized protein YdeI (YjbR/CyaY-like superfamily)